METKELSTIEEIRIYSDPYRMKILSHFQRMDHPATIKEIADAMGEVPAKVYYHAKKLESIGLIHIVSTKEINGINAKYYESFKGAVRIKRDDGADEAAKKIFISETQKLLSDLYDDNKKKFLTAQSNDKPYGNLTNSEVYLTEEEAKKFIEWINQFVDEHHSRKNPDQFKYDIFTTIAKTTDQ
ncbi:helix-turn-helix domain-containing protein [Paenibacillus sp. HJL G12]|uniref:Helix-turn-helix domain-containing protein n=1 Tax=Paenibacillus dendrobii TaxID=2691084 RepID=A0A7X3IJ63_9BACL|nr:helix-turn-helix domain-containing protein [Paenibacillus dendrobii]MWV43575.1 helix-turn-helix domain-containing protein [Paenibacillus dendrobii]